MSPSPWFKLPAVSTASVLYDYGRHGERPIAVPNRWRTAESAMPGSAALDFMSDVDGVAGNSGSVTVDRNGGRHRQYCSAVTVGQMFSAMFTRGS